MECPFCQSGTIINEICRSCGYNEDIALKTRAHAAVLYNKGLNSAKSGNMTASIEALRQCLEFDKTFIEARNLYGLALFNIGKSGDAFRQWRLSLGVDPSAENPANRYVASTRRSPRLHENMRDSIRIYNSALVSARKKSDDLAVIRLKKVLEFNPNFTDAMCLLALVYIDKNQLQRAVRLLRRAVEVDAGCEIALRYLKILNAGQPLQEKKAKSGPLSDGETPYAASETDKYGSKNVDSFIRDLPVAPFTCLLIGAVITFLIVYFGWAKPALNRKDLAFGELFSSVSDTENEYAAEIDELNDELRLLRVENMELNDEIERVRSENEFRDRLRTLDNIQSHVSAGNLEHAFTLLETLDTTGFPPERLLSVAQLEAETRGRLTESSYTAARKHYDEGSYEQAKDYFEKTLTFGGEGSGYAGDAYYFIGRIYEISGDGASAHPYFLRVAEHFPGAANFDNAVTRERNLRP
jgi:tetratricopeptide (TPR) repeat protein